MEQRTVRNFSDANAQPFLLKGGPHGILLIHGFTGSPGHMRLIGEALHKEGYTVQGILLPGHGTRMEDMVGVRWQDWLQAAKEGVFSLKKICEQVSVAGLSMGGVLALLAAQQTRIQSVITLSAPMGIKSKASSVARMAAPFKPVTYWKGGGEREKLLDMQYDYGYPGFPTARVADLKHLIRIARRNLFAVTCPTLVIQSRGDSTIHPNSADVILNGILSEKKAVLWLEDVPHVVTISKEYQTIASAMAEFLKSASVLEPHKEKFSNTVDKGAEL